MQATKKAIGKNLNSQCGGNLTFKVESFARAEGTYGHHKLIQIGEEFRVESRDSLARSDLTECCPGTSSTTHPLSWSK